MKTHRSNNRSHALTLVEVLAVVVILFILAAMLLPGGIGPGKSPQKIACVNNLKQIWLAEKIWAGDHGDQYPMDVAITDGGTRELFSAGSHFQNLVFLTYLTMSNELSTPKVLHCPADTNTFALPNFSTDFCNRNVSYFVGMNTETNFVGILVSGDDNFEIGGVPIKSGLLELSTNAPISWTTARHNKTGNLLLGDGSVQSTTTYGLRTCWQQTGLATNRLAIP